MMIDEIFGLSFRIADSLLLAMYYSAFLLPRNKKISRGVLFFCFGAAYFVIQEAVRLLYVSLISLTGRDSIGLLTPQLELAASFAAPLILMAAVWFLSAAFFRTSAALRLFLLCSFFAVQQICFCIVDSSGLNAYQIPGMVLEFAAYFGLCFLSFYIITKTFSNKSRTFTPVELLYLILPCVSGLMLVSIIKVLYYKVNMSGVLEIAAKVPYAPFLIPLAGLVFLVSLIAAVKLFQKLAELHADERERIVLQNQIQQMRGVYAEMRSVRHDMKSHIANMELLLNAARAEKPDTDSELTAYFEKIKESINQFDFASRTGNPVTDIILYQKEREAAEDGIAFMADFLYPARMGIDVYDLAIILSNALENALEACGYLPSDNRFIRLYSYIKGEMFFVEIENSFDGQLVTDERTGLPQSRKSDRTAHGIGLSNVRRCARKYFGEMSFQISAEEQPVFRLTVMLQNTELFTPEKA